MIEYFCYGLFYRVRNFDRYYLKPFLTHEVPVNADNKLADLLKIVRPDRNTNAYDNPSFTLKSNRNSANEPIEKVSLISLYAQNLTLYW